jgi:hypothetical protein
MNKFNYNKNLKYKGQSINILVWNKDYKFPNKQKTNLTNNK